MPKIPVTSEAVVFMTSAHYFLGLVFFLESVIFMLKIFNPFTLYMYNMYALESFSFSYWTLCLLQVIVGPEKMIVVPPRHYCVVENPAMKDKDNKPVFDTHGQVCGWVESVSVCVGGVECVSVCVCGGGGGCECVSVCVCGGGGCECECGVGVCEV